MSEQINGAPTGTTGGANIGAIEAGIIAAGAPYSSPYHLLGSPPSAIPDAPVSLVFMVLFMICSASNIIVFVRNKKGGHKFGFSMAFNAFCVIRVFSTALRTAWSFHPTNTNLALAAQIFVYCGTIILYIVDLFLAQRLMRARHPKLGWSPLFTIICPPIVVACTVITVLLVIVAVLQMSYATDPNILRIDTDITIYVETFFLVVAFLPTLICLLAVLLPRHTYLDKFGAGRFRTKVLILTFASCILTFGAGWRTAIAWMPEVPITAAVPWYLSKACFYIMNYGIEITVLVLYLVTRVDRRFYVPDGASGPFSYSGDVVADDQVRAEKEAEARGTPWGNSFYLPTYDRTMPSQSTEGILADIPEGGEMRNSMSTVTLQDKYGYNGGYYAQHHPHGSEWTIPEGAEQHEAYPREVYGPQPPYSGRRSEHSREHSQDGRKMSMMSGVSSSGSYLEVDKAGRWKLREVEDEYLSAPGEHRHGQQQQGPNASQWTLGGTSVAPSEYAHSEQTTRTF